MFWAYLRGIRAEAYQELASINAENGLEAFALESSRLQAIIQVLEKIDDFPDMLEEIILEKIQEREERRDAGA